MRTRRGRAQRIRAAESGAEAVASGPAPDVTWEDLSEAEQTALKRMNRGYYPDLDEALGERLTHLGLAVRRPEGTGISRKGRALVIDRLLEGRREDPDR